MTNSIGWFDIKAKLKQTIRAIFYSGIFQKLICLVLTYYIKLVYLTSKVRFIGENNLLLATAHGQSSVIIAMWHEQIMMSPLLFKNTKEVNKNNKMACLTSKHGDGQFVGKIMENFGIINISGSTQNGRKSDRGIDIGSFRKIFKVLKNEFGVAITPDGPRGPARKINGQIIKISSLSNSTILPCACGYSRFMTLNTWDNFKVPLPFSKIIYYFGEPMAVKKGVTDIEIKDLNSQLENNINKATQESISLQTS